MKKNIVIIILSVVILGLCGFLVYDKINENNNKGKTNVGEGYNVLSRTLIDNIIELNVYNIFERLSKSGLSEEIKLAMSLSNLEPVDSYSCSDAFEINNNYEYRSGKNNLWGCGQNEKVDSFNYNLVNKEYKKLFGNLENAEKIGVLETWVYDYSNKINSYVRLLPRFGPIISNLYYYDVENIDLENERLNIEISYLTYTILNLNAVDEFQYTLNDVKYTNKTQEEIKQAYYDNKNLLPRLTFNYEKEDGKYVLKSVGNQS